MNIFSFFEDKLHNILQEKFSLPDSVNVKKIIVERPRDAAHGDLATNAALVLAKDLGMKPRDLAAQLVKILQADENIESAEIAGPGFVNLRLTKDFWRFFAKEAFLAKAHYGFANQGEGCKVNLEYVSANPTGPMHVGHCRGAVVGDVLARLLTANGYDVTKEYYINDAGNQIDILARSVFLRYKEALGHDIGEIEAGLYPGEYLCALGHDLAKEFGDKLLFLPEGEVLPLLKNKAVAAMMAMIKEDLMALNIQHDVFFAESFLHRDHQQPIKDALQELTQRGYIYKGKLEAPKGHSHEDWEDREQILFRSTSVGDDQDRALVKSDGSYTYFAADVAYFKNKYDRGFKKMIYILGADHGGYVKRLEAVAKAMSGGEASLKVLLCQLVKLYRNGEPTRMSKRAGSFVTLRQVVDEVGRDSVRFMMIFRKAEMALEFDFAKVTEQSKDNPVFYVQYACARCYSIFRQAQEAFKFNPEETVGALKYLQYEEEFDFLKKMAQYPAIIAGATLFLEPHRLSFYLYEIAAAFHALWNKGTEKPELRFVNKEDKEITQARLALLHIFRNILESGLDIIGVAAPKKMI